MYGHFTYCQSTLYFLTCMYRHHFHTYRILGARGPYSEVYMYEGEMA
jgi:hypothetical protein